MIISVHDHNLAVMQNGEVKHFLQQERISRRKRGNARQPRMKPDGLILNGEFRLLKQ